MGALDTAIDGALDPLDGAIDGVVGDKRKANAYHAVQQNPDEFAQATQLSRSTGIPAPVVARNLPQVKQRADLDALDGVLDQSPAVRKAMDDPTFAILARDDTETLAEIGRTADRRAGGVIGGAAYQRPEEMKASQGPEASFVSVVSGMFKALPQGGEQTRQGMRMQFADAIGSPEMSLDAMRRYQRAQTEGVISTPQFDSLTAAGLYSGGVSLIQQAPGLAASILMRTPVPGLAGIGVQTESTAYGKYRSRGATPGEALAGGVGEGAVEVATELLPMSFLVNRFGKAGAGEFLAGLLAREIPSEQIATLVQDAIDTAVANPDKTWSQYLAERPGAAYQTLVATVAQAGAMGVINTVAQRVAAPTAQAEAAGTEAETLAQLSQLAAASKLRERDPQTFEQYVETAAPGQEVYLDARTLQQSGVDLAALAQASPAVAAQLTEALATGGDIVLPVSEYAARLAGTDLDTALLPHLRATEDALSQDEAQRFYQGQAEEFKKAAAQVMEDKATDDAWQASAKAVETQLLDQLQQTNRFTPDVNNAYATLMRDFYVATAGRLGVTPEEMAAKYPIRVTARATEGGQVLSQDVGADATSAAAATPIRKLFQSVTNLLKGGDPNGKEGQGRRQEVLTDGGAAPLDIGQFFQGQGGYSQKRAVSLHTLTDEGNDQAVVAQALMDHAATLGTENFGDVLVRAAQAAKADGLGGIPTLTPVLTEMRRAILDDLKVLDAVIAAAPIDVMNNFAGGEGAAKVALHDEAMLQESPAFNADLPIAETPEAARAVSLLAREVARMAAKTFAGTSDARGEAAEGSTTVGASEGNSFSQGGSPSGNRAEIRFSEDITSTPTVITLFANADLSSALHELGHFQLEVLAHIASQPNAPAEIVQDFEAVLKWFGITGTEAVAGGDTAGSLGQPAYHGSPYKFDKFSLEHIGKGEGAQAYGWGLYFAGKKGIAEHYRKVLSKTTPAHNTIDGKRITKKVLEDLQSSDDNTVRAFFGSKSGMRAAGTTNIGKAVDDAIETAQENRDDYQSRLDQHRARPPLVSTYGPADYERFISSYDRQIERLQALKSRLGYSKEQKSGQLYEVDIPEEGQYLLWDKPLSEQPDAVKAALKDAEVKNRSGQDMLTLNPTGEEILNALGKNEAASGYLNSLGIAGIKYLDGTSRSQGEGTFNYVVFDDTAVEILSTYYQGGDEGVRGPLPQRQTPLEVWQAMSLEEKRPYHEQFARGFESYLFEGKAPSQELASVFQRFRAWLVSVYKSIKALNVEISDDIRGVFDRLVATDEAIKAAETARAYAPLFPDDPEAQALATKATQDATEELQRRSLRDMRWLDNARGRILKQMQADAKAKRKSVEDEVRAEVAAMPVWQAKDFIKESPEADRDTVAEMFGFTSGDHLNKEIKAAGNRASLIEGMTDQRVLERYGDLSSPDTLARAVDEAIHNEARLRMLATELKALNKAAGPVRAISKAAKDFAEAMVARQQVKAIKPARRAAAETRAAKAAEKALAAGDTALAADEKRNQLIQNYATRASYDALTEIDRALRYFTKLDGEGSRKNLDAEYLDQIDALLERFDFRKSVSNKAAKKRATLIEWVQSQRDEGFEPDIPPDLLAEAARKPYKEMTLEELRGLVDTVKQIEHLGRLKHKLLTAKDEREFKAIRDEIAASIVEHAKEVRDLRTRNLTSDALKDAGARFLAMHRKMASVSREMDGFKDGGPMWEYLIRSMNNAGNRESGMRADATARLHELIKPLLASGKMGGKGLYFESLGGSFNREERIAIALNMGNTGNTQRLLDGEGWTMTRLRPLLDTITAEEADFVQSVWDFFESYRPEIGAKERRIYGKEPEWVEPVPLMLGGKEIKGGYYPVKYDRARSERAAAHEDAESAKAQMKGAYTSSTTRRSFTKARAEEVTGRPLLYSFAGIYQGTNEVIHDLSWHEWLIDANRLVRSLSGVISTHYGDETRDLFKKAIEDIAAGDVPAQNVFERGINHLRMGATIAGLGWNFSTALLQPFGLTQSMVRIGPAWVVKGFSQWIKSPIDTGNDVRDRSAFMRDRARTMQREINEIQNQVRGSKLDPVRATFFLMIQKMQMVADMPTWLGAYEKAIAEGNAEDRAVSLADQAVMDAQGGGQVKDLAQIQRGGPLLKLWTNFYSFFNTTYNLAVEKTKEKGGTPKLYPSLAMDYLLLFTIPCALVTLVKAALQADTDDEDELVKKLAADQISYLLGTMVGLREITAAMQKLAGVEQFKSSYGGPAGLRMFQEVDKLSTQMAQGEVDAALLKAINNTAGNLLHYPSGQINRTAGGTAALIEGKTDNPMAVLLGPPPKR